MMISATEFRGDLYRFLDQVLETGKPLEIKRNGHILKIIPEAEKPKKNKLAGLKKRNNVISCDPNDLIHQDWLLEWSENK
jgi:PHD/YefM family antitoxin component YafN of YafNO toxin-antitoxin module